MINYSNISSTPAGVNHFLKYYIKILLGDFNAKLGREDIFNTKTQIESLIKDSNGNGVKS
jgi:hypothetical protein